MHVSAEIGFMAIGSPGMSTPGTALVTNRPIGHAGCLPTNATRGPLGIVFDQVLPVTPCSEGGGLVCGLISPGHRTSVLERGC